MAKYTSMHFLLLLLPYNIYSLLISTTSAAGPRFSVADYGGKADGKTDSAQPFLRAWAAACSSSLPATIVVPSGRFLVSPITFSGPCKNKAIKFLVSGTVVAPSVDISSNAADKWIGFDNVDGVSVHGGVFDGRGAALWECKWAQRKLCPDGATSLLVTNSRNVEIVGLTSTNSQLFHIVILRCQGVRVASVNIVAPGNSPNTDGVHVQMSAGVTISQTSIRTGDDCVSIGPGTSGLLIDHVLCGPGHGISIGSLGKDQVLGQTGVSNVTVKSVIFSGTQNGLRIKTWGTLTKGYVYGVIFMDVVMRGVENPIIIDQSYCPANKNCPTQSSHIGINNVEYRNIRGTSYTQKAVNFGCSSSTPCRNIKLQNINLTYKNQPAHSMCKNVLGTASGFMVPPSCV